MTTNSTWRLLTLTSNAANPVIDHFDHWELVVAACLRLRLAALGTS